MTSILQAYIPKFLVNLQRENEDLIKVSTRYFSPAGDVYTLDKRTVSPSIIQTNESLNELKPETSDVYPFKIVVPRDIDGSAVISTPNLDTFPTASQDYYIPIYFERYSEEVIRAIDREFTELTVSVAILSPEAE